MARGKQQGQTKRKFKWLRRLRRLGFRARKQTVGGRNVLKSRRAKKRSALSVHEAVGNRKARKDKKFSRRR